MGVLYVRASEAEAIGKPRTTIADSLSLTTLPVAIRDECCGKLLK
jgi:hypothetical protein